MITEMSVTFGKGSTRHPTNETSWVHLFKSTAEGLGWRVPRAPPVYLASASAQPGALSARSIAPYAPYVRSRALHKARFDAMSHHPLLDGNFAQATGAFVNFILYFRCPRPNCWTLQPILAESRGQGCPIRAAPASKAPLIAGLRDLEVFATLILPCTLRGFL